MIPELGKLVEAIRVALTTFGVRLYEQPSYTVERRLGRGVEVRRYAARPAVATTSNDPAAFNRLAAYIYGGNGERREIAMTLPVAEHGAPAFPAGAEQSGSDMMFFLPRSLAERGAPLPVDPGVRLVVAPAERLAVVPLGGIPMPNRVAEHGALLREALQSEGLEPAGAATLFIYDPPWTLPFFRHSEVAIPIADFLWTT